MKILPLILVIIAVCCVSSSAATAMIYFSWGDVKKFFGFVSTPVSFDGTVVALPPPTPTVVSTPPPTPTIVSTPPTPTIVSTPPTPTIVSTPPTPSSSLVGGTYCRGGYCLDVARFSAAYNAERETKSGLPPCEWNERVADNCWCISKYCGRCDNDPYLAMPYACGVGTHCGDWAWGRVCHVTNEPGGLASAPVPPTEDVTDVAIDAMRRLGDAASHRGTVHSATASTMGVGFTKCGPDKMLIVLTGAGAGGEFGPGGYKHNVRPCPK